MLRSRLASGWGNVMQELLMNHYLAYRAGHSFVFDNFTWNDDGSLYSYFNGKPIPSRIPISAHIQGPTAGGVFITDPAAPRAVMKEFFDEICPHPTIIRNDDIIRSLGRESTAEVMIEKWVEVLRAIDDRCVEVARGSIFGSRDRLLDVWPSFSRSPVVTEFAWSPLIELAFDANREIFAPSATAEPFLLSSPFTGNNAERYTPIPGLLALHIRRGDFEEHCRKLPGWGSSYVGYASFPEFGDRLHIPPGAEPEERAEIYRRHCFPEIDEIVSKVEEVHASEAGRGLRHVFVMTNGSREWLAQLEAALMRSGIWTSVTSSRDLLLNAEQEYVKQAVDMLIGHRSQVFIGNGFSSLTGQVNMLRMAYGFPPETNRFW
ncbi:hypothetical protein WOLCODRAFT_61697 [Wolfiporia cocos MD-104 SS10]|uniref:Uncharacterized protein n=1 Tax=Wolfiporia cocos (strain MD-104) TaxID=742152 RepID=A0A2H3IWQ4_WOLCO|nr:hypothetical protein WOLCODRAFT_61697 [Wolfiporia cocos MD-104 SS10]